MLFRFGFDFKSNKQKDDIVINDGRTHGRPNGRKTEREGDLE